MIEEEKFLLFPHFRAIQSSDGKYDDKIVTVEKIFEKSVNKF